MESTSDSKKSEPPDAMRASMYPKHTSSTVALLFICFHRTVDTSSAMARRQRHSRMQAFAAAPAHAQSSMQEGKCLNAGIEGRRP